MSFVRTAFLATALLSTSATLVKADVKVVASIKPVHSLVSGVMGDLGAPDLLVEGAGSPHTYSLKPSQAKKLQETRDKALDDEKKRHESNLAIIEKQRELEVQALEEVH